MSNKIRRNGKISKPIELPKASIEDLENRHVYIIFEQPNQSENGQDERKNILKNIEYAIEMNNKFVGSESFDNKNRYFKSGLEFKEFIQFCNKNLIPIIPF